MLTSETIKKLQLEQEKLDQFIVQKKNLTDIDSKAGFVRTKIALLVEIGELANELKTFKHWKSQKDINWEKAKEELIDCLHFYLSWANSFAIDFSDYKFHKLVSEPDFNELLLAFFSETESFIIVLPLNIRIQNMNSMIATNEKRWEDNINKFKLEGKITEKEIVGLRKTKEEQSEIIKKMNNNLLTRIEDEKNRSSFYRWLIIFEELAQKLGMKSERDIEEAYMKKNKVNWERQQKNY